MVRGLGSSNLGILEAVILVELCSFCFDVLFGIVFDIFESGFSLYFPSVRISDFESN